VGGEALAGNYLHICNAQAMESENNQKEGGREVRAKRITCIS
jgi:hypothetical protein